MAVHIGERIRLRAKELRIGPTELGRMINTSKQNVYGIFHRKSIDTELLRKLSKALQCDFFQYYWTETRAYSTEPEDDYGKKKSKVSSEELKKLRRELEESRYQNQLQKKVITFLENEKKKKGK
jgi:hypothetical protein